MDAVAALPPGGGLIGAACAALGLSRASFHRRTATARRPPAPFRPRPRPARALAVSERQAVLDLLREPRFVDQPPAEVYAELLDEGVYHCSTRTMYRILDENGEVRERRNLLRHPHYHKPELLAEGPNQVWSWDITKLRPGQMDLLHLYVIMDIFSRTSSAGSWPTPKVLLCSTMFSESGDKQEVLPGQLTIHADRGPSMKSKPRPNCWPPWASPSPRAGPMPPTTIRSRKASSRPQVPASVPRTLRLHPGRQSLLPQVFPMVQRRTPPSRNRPDDARPRPLRPGRRSLRCPKAGPRKRLPRQPEPFRKNHRLPAKSQPTVWINPPQIKPEIQA